MSATPFADIAAREAELARALHAAQEVKYLAALNAAKTVKPFAKQRALEMAAEGGKKAAAAARVGWCKLNPVGTRIERDWISDCYWNVTAWFQGLQFHLVPLLQGCCHHKAVIRRRDPPPFPRFKDGPFKGWTPSATNRSDMFCSFMIVLMPLLLLHLQLINDKVCSLDHTFRISKYIWVG
jgi:hypothetical protein